MSKHAVGVMNGNWRNGFYVQRQREIETEQFEVATNPNCQYWKDAVVDARDELKAVDPGGWETWWDSDAMPDHATFQRHAEIIRERIEELKEKKNETNPPC